MPVMPGSWALTVLRDLPASVPHGSLHSEQSTEEREPSHGCGTWQPVLTPDPTPFLHSLLCCAASSPPRRTERCLRSLCQPGMADDWRHATTRERLAAAHSAPATSGASRVGEGLGKQRVALS